MKKMKQKLIFFLPLILIMALPLPVQAQATEAATITAGTTGPTFLLIILGGSLFLAGWLLFRRVNFKGNL
jgi:hypothetical protein